MSGDNGSISELRLTLHLVQRAEDCGAHVFFLGEDSIMRRLIFKACILAMTIVVAEVHYLDRLVAGDETSIVKGALVATLVSRNKEPALPNPRSEPSFDAGFDWSEQSRVWESIAKLFSASAEEWDELTNNINNDKYSITVAAMSGSSYNVTAGEVCMIIINKTLSEPYYRSMKPVTRDIYSHFRIPEFARGPKVFKEWLDARRGKTLPQMQADACEWAIQSLAKQNDENRDRWTAEMRKTVDALRAGGASITCKGFGSEEYEPYSRPRRK